MPRGNTGYAQNPLDQQFDENDKIGTANLNNPESAARRIPSIIKDYTEKLKKPENQSPQIQAEILRKIRIAERNFEQYCRAIRARNTEAMRKAAASRKSAAAAAAAAKRMEEAGHHPRVVELYRAKGHYLEPPICPEKFREFMKSLVDLRPVIANDTSYRRSFSAQRRPAVGSSSSPSGSAGPKPPITKKRVNKYGHR